MIGKFANYTPPHMKTITIPKAKAQEIKLNVEEINKNIKQSLKNHPAMFTQIAKK